jgi:molybdenum-dependent DNA-binding transcriptional regulator ModE
MDLDVLKTFCDLVDSGSFTKAAEANFITQSAVSQQVARLEKALGAQLIERARGLVRPTEAGKAFYQGAREILRRYERLAGEVRSTAAAVRGVLRVGTIYSVGFYRLDAFFRRFLREHPEVNLHVEYTLPGRIYSAAAMCAQMSAFTRSASRPSPMATTSIEWIGSAATYEKRPRRGVAGACVDARSGLGAASLPPSRTALSS